MIASHQLSSFGTLSGPNRYNIVTIKKESPKPQFGIVYIKEENYKLIRVCGSMVL